MLSLANRLQATTPHLQGSGPYSPESDGVWDVRDRLGLAYALFQSAALLRGIAVSSGGGAQLVCQRVTQQDGDLGVQGVLSVRHQASHLHTISSLGQP